jgi:hypothetical protein
LIPAWHIFCDLCSESYLLHENWQKKPLDSGSGGAYKRDSAGCWP